MNETEYTVDVENLTQLMRVFVAGAKAGADPYVFAATVLWHDLETVEIKGVRVEAWTDFVTMRGAVARAMAERGAKHVTWVRKNRGRERVVSMNVSRYLQPKKSARKLRIQSLIRRLNRPV